jgi:hypothetical protein
MKKGIFKKIITSLNKIWVGATAIFKKYVTPAIAVVNVIKSIVDSGITQAIVDLTPFKIDDTILALLKQYIPKLLTDLQIAQTVADATTPEEQINALLQFLATAAPDIQDAIYHKISSLLVKYQIADDGVGGTFSQSDLDFIVSLGYSAWKEQVSKIVPAQ